MRPRSWPTKRATNEDAGAARISSGDPNWARIPPVWNTATLTLSQVRVEDSEGRLGGGGILNDTELTATDVKRIILLSATRYSDRAVLKPGGRDGELVPFGTLSATGGVVNALAAVKMAEGGRVRP